MNYVILVCDSDAKIQEASYYETETEDSIKKIAREVAQYMPDAGWSVLVVPALFMTAKE